MGKFTIKDIARLANVSNATVSRVINNYPYINEKTKMKVQRIISKTDYQPNTLARSLVTKKSGMIGVIVWDLASPFFSEIVREIGIECREKNYQPIFCSTDGNDKIQAEYIELLLQKNIEGFIIATAHLHDPQIERLVLRGYPPVVLIDRRLQTELASYVTVDNVEGAYMATKHLIDHGHKRIACVSGQDNSSSGLERLEGYKKALAESNIPIDQTLIIPGNFLRAGGYRAAEVILSLKEKRPTAIFCSNDSMALGMLEFFGKRGIRVPQDIALVGFDDISISSLNFIQLSTISSRKVDVVKNAINILIKKISNPDDDTQYGIKIKPKLVIRNSCGCAKYSSTNAYD